MGPALQEVGFRLDVELSPILSRPTFPARLSDATSKHKP